MPPCGAASTTSGPAAVTSLRSAVKTRTSSPDLCTWTARRRASTRTRASPSASTALRARRGLRQHRQDRPHRPDGEALEARLPLRQRRARRRRDAAADHDRAPDHCRRRRRSRGERLEHHALEGALARARRRSGGRGSPALLAVALPNRRVEQLGALAGRSSAFGCFQLLKCGIHFAQGERRRAQRLAGTQRAIAQSELALAAARR